MNPVDFVEQYVRMPGQFYDKHSKLNYNYFRDYNPLTGRYMQSDPIGVEGGLNTYAYVEGNPLRFIDVFGLRSTARRGSQNNLAHNSTARRGPRLRDIREQYRREQRQMRESMNSRKTCKRQIRKPDLRSERFRELDDLLREFNGDSLPRRGLIEDIKDITNDIPLPSATDNLPNVAEPKECSC